MNKVFIKQVRNVLISCNQIIVVIFICSMSLSRAMDVGIINSVAFVGNTRIALAGDNGCKLYSINKNKDSFFLCNGKSLCSGKIIDMSVSYDCKHLGYAMPNKVKLYNIFPDCVEECYSQDVGEMYDSKIYNIACGKKFLFIFYKNNNSLYSYGLLSYEYNTKKSLNYDLSDLRFRAGSPAMSCQLEGNMVLVQAYDPSKFLIDVSDSNKFDKYEHIKNSFQSVSNKALSGIFNHNDSIVAINSGHSGYVLYDATDRDRAIATISHEKSEEYASIALYQSDLAALLKSRGDAVEFWSYIVPKNPKCIVTIKLSWPTISLSDEFKIALDLQSEQKIDLLDRNLNRYSDGSKLLAFSPNRIRFAAAVMNQLFISDNPLDLLDPLETFCSKKCIERSVLLLCTLKKFLLNSLRVSNNDVVRLILKNLINLYLKDTSGAQEMITLMPITIREEQQKLSEQVLKNQYQEEDQVKKEKEVEEEEVRVMLDRVLKTRNQVKKVAQYRYK